MTITPNQYNPKDWYYQVTAVSPPTNIWKTNGGYYTDSSDVEYIAWLAKGNILSTWSDTEANFIEQILRINNLAPAHHAPKWLVMERIQKDGRITQFNTAYSGLDDYHKARWDSRSVIYHDSTYESWLDAVAAGSNGRDVYIAVQKDSDPFGEDDLGYVPY